MDSPWPGLALAPAQLPAGGRIQERIKVRDGQDVWLLKIHVLSYQLGQCLSFFFFTGDTTQFLVVKPQSPQGSAT